MKQSTIELCLAALGNANVPQIGDHREEVLAIYDAMDDLRAALEDAE